MWGLAFSSSPVQRKTQVLKFRLKKRIFLLARQIYPSPLRSRSAKMFIGPELSTQTISFNESLQHECDALREENKIRWSFWQVLDKQPGHQSNTNQATVPSPEPKSRRNWGENEGSLFFIWSMDMKRERVIHEAQSKRGRICSTVLYDLMQSSLHGCIASSEPSRHVDHRQLVIEPETHRG